MLTQLHKTPFPWFGGKADAAVAVWEALGDVVEWFKSGFLKGGMSNGSKRGHQQGRERLWLSPHCLGPVKAPQSNLFEVAS
jgi:hypothetical protein